MEGYTQIHLLRLQMQKPLIMCDCREKCPTCKALEREKKIKELLKDLEMELPQPIFEKVKEELIGLLN